MTLRQVMWVCAGAFAVVGAAKMQAAGAVWKDGAAFFGLAVLMAIAAELTQE